MYVNNTIQIICLGVHSAVQFADKDKRRNLHEVYLGLELLGGIAYKLTEIVSYYNG